jgi:uncharacterized membrane protein
MMDARSAIVASAEDSLSAPGWPSTREFVTSAGFAGLMALLAAIVIALVVLFVVLRISKRHQVEMEQRQLHEADEQAKNDRATELAVVDERFRWVVETAGIEPASSEHATLRLGPELALELLTGLLADAQRLADKTLAKAITVYLNQFSLVLTQQGGPLSQLKNGSAPSETAPATAASSPAADPAPAGAEEPATKTAADIDSAVTTATTGRRRRR